MKTHAFTINLWNFIDIDDLNEALDEAWEHAGNETHPVDISFKVRLAPGKNLSEGNIEILATFNEESDNEGCDKCGTYDREPNSKLCKHCAESGVAA